nr:MAG TPA: hypothetical protein [Caudoviricetes sp.]
MNIPFARSLKSTNPPFDRTKGVHMLTLAIC